MAYRSLSLLRIKKTILTSSSASKRGVISASCFSVPYICLSRALLRSVSTSSQNKMPDHTDVTSEHSRDDVVTEASVCEINDLSESVKLLKLNVPDEKFTFKAGQWVDFFIPEVETVGGFSMCSSPDLLKTSHILHLAIKYSKHPPAYWVHTKCRAGDSVKIRSGGDFFYDPSTYSPTAYPNVLLLAGGVGINPLYSILLHIASISKLSSSSHHTNKQKVTMLYSAKSEDELIFKNELINLEKSFSNINVQLFCTQEKATENDFPGGRINRQRISSALDDLDRTNTETFICGPLSFLNDMETFCLGSGLKQSNIHYEKWW